MSPRPNTTLVERLRGYQVRKRLIFAFAVVLAALIGTGASAREYTVGKIRVLDPWTRATAAAGANAAGFVTITNDGTTPDRLVGAECPVAASTTIHASRDDNGVMTMRPVGGVDIAPGETVKLAPGGLHLMLMETNRPLVHHDWVRCKLEFRNAGTIEVPFLVRAAGAIEPLMGPIESE